MNIDSLEFRSKIVMCVDKSPKNVKDISDITDNLLKLFKEELILSGVGVSTSVTEKAKDLIGGIFELTQKTNNGVMDLNRATDALYSFINQN
jgi:accessory colonization factor AcfC